MPCAQEWYPHICDGPWDFASFPEILTGRSQNVYKSKRPPPLWHYVRGLNDVMSVVGKSTCSGFKIGLYISYHGGKAGRYIKQRGYFLKDGRIPGSFYTKFMTVFRIEQIRHNF